MQIIDGHNSKFTPRVSSQERLEVWMSSSIYIRPRQGDVWLDTTNTGELGLYYWGYPYYFDGGKWINYYNSESKNLLPNHLFYIEE